MRKIGKSIRSISKHAAAFDGIVLDVGTDGHASVQLSQTGAIYKQLKVYGSPVAVGDDIIVDFTDQTPKVLSYGPGPVEPTPTTRIGRRATRLPASPSKSGVFGWSMPFDTSGSGTDILVGFIEIPFECNIERVTLVGDVSGSISVDIRVCTYANFPPDNNDSIVGTSPPALSSEQKYQDTTFDSWTTLALHAGDWMGILYSSAETIQLATLSIKGKVL